MKVIIAGSRDFNDWDAFMGHMSVLPLEFDIKTVVSGGARGADRLGEQFGELMGFRIIRFLPDWDKHGKPAGIYRNKAMGDYADALIAFWNGKSKGTKHMIQYMYKLNKPVHLVAV